MFKKRDKQLYRVIVIDCNSVVHKLEPMNFKKASKEYEMIKKTHDLVFIKREVNINEELFKK